MSSAYVSVVDYYGDGFTRAYQIGDSHRYQFDATDDLIYAFVHFVKHYLTGGARIRNIYRFVLCLWVRGGEDEARLEALLEKHESPCLLQDLPQNRVMAWFGGSPLDEAGN